MSSETRTPDNQLGRDVATFLPDREAVRGLPELTDVQQRIWDLAAPHLRVRGNDRHSLYAFGIAAATAARSPGQASGFCGGFQRSAPSGGAA